MAAADVVPNFGSELKDGFKPVNAWVSNGIAWLDDIQGFYRERSAIEKEYGAKLSALAKRYHEKKAKKIGSLSVGDTPTLTPGSLESASLTTWTTQLSTLERRAAEHDRYAAEINYQVADPLKNIAIRYEEIRRHHADYAAKLEKEKEAAFVELKRTKGKYDASCSEVESRRKKIESSFADKAKAQNAYQNQIAEMHNVKNTYLININVTNKQKQKYYYDYVPELLDSLQDLSETRTSYLNGLWCRAAKLEEDVMTRSAGHMQVLGTEIPRNDPKLDSMMFMRHNAAVWQEPPDMGFEASPVWHDDASMAVDETSKVFLRNILGKSKMQRTEFKREVDQKQKDVEKVQAIRQAAREGRDKRDEVELVRAFFALSEELHGLERKWLTAEVEVATITSTVGDISIGAKNHDFKSQTFKIPTNCDLCGERIWGLSAKGFDCRDCGYTCHNKCELKVPPDCPGEQTKDEKKKLKAERQASAAAAPRTTTTAVATTNGGPPHASVAELPVLSRSDTSNTMNSSLSSGYAASAHRSVSGKATTTAELDNANAVPAPTARRNRAIAPPPIAYANDSHPPPNGGHDDAARSAELRGKMLYPYTANGEGELSVDEGTEVLVLEPDDGSGWLTVRPTTSPTSGIVPASYVSTQAPPTPTSGTFPPRPYSSYSTTSSTTSLPHSTLHATHSSTSINTTGGGKKKGPAVAPKRGARKLVHVTALYDYQARSEQEWSMREGERFVLVNREAGDGWADVEKGGVTRSVPANYLDG